MAVSPLDPAVIQAKYQALETAQRKSSATEDFMDMLAERRAKAGHG